MYLVKTPWWLRHLYSTLTWRVATNEKKLFLTFDDGPHPAATIFVLDTLKQYNAKGTFFCLGKNVEAHPDIFRRIIEEGHKVGNHTYDHLNGWKTTKEDYISNINKAHTLIQGTLFRPPYGRIKRSQSKQLLNDYQVIMWDILSGDFDVNLSAEKCLQNVIANARQGSIVVFHDSQKAFSKLSYALPKTLEYFSKMGYSFCSL